MRAMQKHQVDAVVPVGMAEGIDYENHDEDDELNELEKLAGLKDKTRPDMELEISDDDEENMYRNTQPQ